MSNAINTETLLPIGERLKLLLNKSCISENDMKELLANRGIFISRSDKYLSIPILTLSIISPKEFEHLQELQKTKEDGLKTKVSQLTSNSKLNLTDELPLDLIKADDLSGEYDCFRFNTDLSFSIDSSNKLTLEYSIVREDITKDWVDSTSIFTGRVEIEKNQNDGTIAILDEHTSSETENINHKIIEKISKHLFTNGTISKSSPIEITPDKFDNRNRFTFMLRLANNSPNGFLEFQAIKNVEIGPDREITIPEDKWISEDVQNLIINSVKGKTLGSLEYISNEQYRDFLILRQVQAQYKFNIGIASGTCIIEYGFPQYFRTHKRNTSFSSSISKVYFDKGTKNASETGIRRAILKEFNLLLQDELKSITDMSSYISETK